MILFFPTTCRISNLFIIKEKIFPEHTIISKSIRLTPFFFNVYKKSSQWLSFSIFLFSVKNIKSKKQQEKLFYYSLQINHENKKILKIPVCLVAESSQNLLSALHLLAFVKNPLPLGQSKRFFPRNVPLVFARS